MRYCHNFSHFYKFLFSQPFPDCLCIPLMRNTAGILLRNKPTFGMILELFINNFSLTVENPLIFFAVEKKPRHVR